MSKPTYKEFQKNLATSPYPKWSNDPNTSSVPNDPQNLVNRAKGEPNKIAPSVNISGSTTSVTDGKTSTKYSSENDPALKALHTEVPSIGNMNHPEKQHYGPCLNSRCKSFGKPHYGCLCYAGPGGSSLEGGICAH